MLEGFAEIHGGIEPAGQPDFQNGAAGINEHVAGMLDSDVVNIMDEGKSGCFLKDVAQIVFGDVELPGDLFDFADCSIILVDVRENQVDLIGGGCGLCGSWRAFALVQNVQNFSQIDENPVAAIRDILLLKQEQQLFDPGE
ncbi:hypothetical protein D3C80_1656710 [compost metagenome]